MKKIDLFLFDLDGTLIDSKRDIASSVHYTMAVLGLPPIDDETIYSFVGNGVTPLIQKSVETSIGGAEVITFEKALAVFRKHYDEHCLDTTQPFPGVLDVLRHFGETPKVIITNKSQGFSQKILDGLGVTPLFEGLYGGDTEFPKKPDPAVVRHLLQSFKARPEATVIIGDSRIDMETGRNGGILTCGVTYGFRPREELEEIGCDYLIESPSELAKIFVSS